MAGVFFFELNQIGHSGAPFRRFSAGQVSCHFARTASCFWLKSMTFKGFFANLTLWCHGRSRSAWVTRQARTEKWSAPRNSFALWPDGNYIGHANAAAVLGQGVYRPAPALTAYLPSADPDRPLK
jgi:hypothetical protein